LQVPRAWLRPSSVKFQNIFGDVVISCFPQSEIICSEYKHFESDGHLLLLLDRFEFFFLPSTDGKVVWAITQ